MHGAYTKCTCTYKDMYTCMLSRAWWVTFCSGHGIINWACLNPDAGFSLNCNSVESTCMSFHRDIHVHTIYMYAYMCVYLAVMKAKSCEIVGNLHVNEFIILIYIVPLFCISVRQNPTSFPMMKNKSQHVLVHYWIGLTG